MKPNVPCYELVTFTFLKLMSISGVVLFFLILLLDGCEQKTGGADHSWSLPQELTKSTRGLGGGAVLYKYRDGMIALQSPGDVSVKLFMLKQQVDGGILWSQFSCADVPQGYTVFPTVDASSGKLFFLKAYTEDEHLEVNALSANIVGTTQVQVLGENKWIAGKDALFENQVPNLMLDYKAQREPIGGLGIGTINDQEISVPYSVSSQLVKHNGQSIITADGPSSCGLFNSTNGGFSWQLERVADCEALEPRVCETGGSLYLFGTRITSGYELWFSRKSVSGGSWTAPEPIVKTFAAVYGHFTAVTQNDLVHLCWMDCRRNRSRFSVGGPLVENDDIVYCRRKDSDPGWTKDVILSKGVLYSYSPSMSVEGNRIVVAWSGIASAGKRHTEYDPNDIYYVTSKNNGNTWSKPMTATDGAQKGITSGKPSVILINGIIHLLYIHGGLESSDQASSGLSERNQVPWPIYYTQRPFPD